MEALVPYAVYACIALVGLGMAAIVLFGIRNLTYGKANPLTIVLTLIPVAILMVLGFTTNDWSYAGIMTSVVMFVITSASLLMSGLRGLLNF